MSRAEQEWAWNQASLRAQEELEQAMGAAYGPLANQNPEYPSEDVNPFVRSERERPVPIGHGPFTSQERDWRVRVELHTRVDRALLEEQDDAYEYLLESLSTKQRDALLVLAQNTPKQGLSQLVRALHGEWRREKRRTPEAGESVTSTCPRSGRG